jgi:hypothetical protein
MQLATALMRSASMRLPVWKMRKFELQIITQGHRIKIQMTSL